MTKRLLALLLVLAIAPGLAELVEAVAHYAAYGDLADRPGDDHDAKPFGVAEHGCSGTFHLGGCHGGPSAAPVSSAPMVAMRKHALPPPSLPSPQSLHGLPAAAPELRPPIA